MRDLFKKAYMYIEGYECVIEALSFGACGSKTGEMIFNTSLSGYQEILSDPSYAGQFIVFSMPEIGIIGVNDKDVESYSKIPYASGIIVRNYNAFYSNFRAREALHTYLKKHNVMGICDIDTRFLTKLIRTKGALNVIISTEFSLLKKLKSILDSAPKISEINYIKDISTKVSSVHKQGTFVFEYMDFEKNTK